MTSPSLPEKVYSPAIETAFPRRGLRAFCGTDDARHRVLDAIAERFRAGDTAESIADDYEIAVELVAVIAAEAQGMTLPDIGTSPNDREVER